jgi:hypothetical protein
MFLRRLGMRIRQWLNVFDASKTYHPELHYMRGPGPKCLARAASAAEAPNDN